MTRSKEMRTVALALVLSLGACGTSMTVQEAPRDGGDAYTGGIVVNKRAHVRARTVLKVPEMGNALAGDASGAALVVDPDRVLVVNISRMIFGSGKLTLKLDDRQVVKEAAVTSASGAAQGARVTETILQRRREGMRNREEDE